MLKHNSLTRNLIIVAVVTFTGTTSGESQANSRVPSGMPKKVRQFFNSIAGSWRMEGATMGTFTGKWDPGHSTLIGSEHFQNTDGSGFLSDIWHWDGISADGVILNWSCSTNDGFGYGQVRGKLLTPYLMEGVVRGVEFGLSFSANVRMEFQDPNHYNWHRTNAIVDGKRQPDSMTVFTKVKSTNEEEELVRLQHEWLRLETEHADVGRFMADGYTLVTSEGMVITKAQMISFVKSDDFPFTSMKPENVTVQIYGDTAVVKGVIKWLGKEDKSGQFLFTDTWLRRDSLWQCIATHESGWREIQKPDPNMKKFKGLVGEWTYEGEQADPPVAGLPYGPAGKCSGMVTTRYILNGTFLEIKIEDNNPSGKTSIIKIIGYDGKKKNYVENLYISDGSSSVATATFDGRTWTSNQTMTTSDGNKVLGKAVLIYSPDWNSYTLTLEVSPDDGKTWKHWFKEEGTRINK